MTTTVDVRLIGDPDACAAVAEALRCGLPEVTEPRVCAGRSGTGTVRLYTVATVDLPDTARMRQVEA